MALEWPARWDLLQEVAVAKKAELEARQRFVDAVRTARDNGIPAASIAHQAGFTSEAGVRILLKRDAARGPTG